MIEKSFLVFASTLVIVSSIRQESVAGEASLTKNLDKLMFGAEVTSQKNAEPVFKKHKIRLPRRAGAVVIKVMPYGPAHRGLLRPLDVIVKIGKTPIKTPEDFQKALSALKVGKTYSVRVYRRVRVGNKFLWRNGTIKVTPVTGRQAHLAAMRTKKDEVRGVTFYQHLFSPIAVNSKSDLHAYFSVKNGKATSIYLRFQYVADDWLFIRKYTFKLANKTYEIKPGLTDMERDNSARKIWEWYDCEATPKYRSMLVEICKAGDVTLRQEGKQYYKDRKITDDEKQRLKTVLICYEILGGK